MTIGTRIFVARLAGVAVFDPNGDPVGRVRDVVVMFRPAPLPPRVLGLVIEIQHRRRIFVPIGRMTSAEAGAVVLTTGTVNLRQFEQRPGEALVLANLLDRAATIRETGARVTVVDVAMEQQARTRDWVLGRVAVREASSRLGRRRGQVQQVGEHQRLAGPLLEPAQVHRAGRQHDRVRVHRGHPADRDEDAAPVLDLHDETEHPRGQRRRAEDHDHVPDPADRVTVWVEHGDSGEPGNVDPGPRRHGARLPPSIRVPIRARDGTTCYNLRAT